MARSNSEYIASCTVFQLCIRHKELLCHVPRSNFGIRVVATTTYIVFVLLSLHRLHCNNHVATCWIEQQEVNVSRRLDDQTFVWMRLRPAVCPILHLNLTLPFTTRLHFLGPELVAGELRHWPKLNNGEQPLASICCNSGLTFTVFTRVCCGQMSVSPTVNLTACCCCGADEDWFPQRHPTCSFQRVVYKPFNIFRYFQLLNYNFDCPSVLHLNI